MSPRAAAALDVPEPTAKAFCLGTHRTVSPAETWARIVPVFPRVGITRVADVTALDRLGIPVYQAIRPLSRSISVSQGKGATRDAARVSAAMESIEQWHSERLDDLPQVELSLREMRYANPIGIEDLPWLGDARLFEAAPLRWVRALPLGTQSEGWLPRSLVELDFRIAEALVPSPFYLSSNGLASGNCREEALLHGLCELIERHALYMARVEPQRKVAVDPEAGIPDGCRDLIDRMRRAGMKLGIFDVSCEIPLPVFFVELIGDDLGRLWIGSGCHPSPDVALSRALTEAAQSRLTYISGGRDDLTRQTRWQMATPHGAHERYREPAPQRTFDRIRGFWGATVAEDLDWVIVRLEEHGHRSFYVDLTRGGLGIPVIRAFSTGLQEAHHA